MTTWQSTESGVTTRKSQRVREDKQKPVLQTALVVAGPVGVYSGYDIATHRRTAYLLSLKTTTTLG